MEDDAGRRMSSTEEGTRRRDQQLIANFISAINAIEKDNVAQLYGVLETYRKLHRDDVVPFLKVIVKIADVGDNLGWVIPPSLMMYLFERVHTLTLDQIVGLLESIGIENVAYPGLDKNEYAQETRETFKRDFPEKWNEVLAYVFEQNVGDISNYPDEFVEAFCGETTDGDTSRFLNILESVNVAGGNALVTNDRRSSKRSSNRSRTSSGDEVLMIEDRGSRRSSATSGSRREYNELMDVMDQISNIDDVPSDRSSRRSRRSQSGSQSGLEMIAADLENGNLEVDASVEKLRTIVKSRFVACEDTIPNFRESFEPLVDTVFDVLSMDDPVKLLDILSVLLDSTYRVNLFRLSREIVDTIRTVHLDTDTVHALKDLYGTLLECEKRRVESFLESVVQNFGTEPLVRLTPVDILLRVSTGISLKDFRRKAYETYLEEGYTFNAFLDKPEQAVTACKSYFLEKNVYTGEMVDHAQRVENLFVQFLGKAVVDPLLDQTLKFLSMAPYLMFVYNNIQKVEFVKRPSRRSYSDIEGRVKDMLNKHKANEMKKENALVKDLQNQIDALKGSDPETQREIDDLTRRISSLRGKIPSRRSSRSSTGSSAELREQIEFLEEQKRELMEQLQTTERGHKEQIKKLKRQIEELERGAMDQLDNVSVMSRETVESTGQKLGDTLKEIQAYHGKVHTVLTVLEKVDEDISNLNPVFARMTEQGWGTSALGGSRREYYANPDEDYAELRSKEDAQIVLKTVKNDYEILRGPVRVYLKLKTLVERQQEDKSLGIVKRKDDYHAKVCPEVCTQFWGEFENTQTQGPFSRVYGSDQDADTMFEDSLRPTIDNVLGVSNAVFMAYGPSGSGKTFTLIQGTIGRQKYPGMVKLALAYLQTLDKIESVVLSSYQTYNKCSIVPKRNKTIKFDSLAANVTSPSTAVANMVSMKPREFEAYLDGALKSVYKYEQSEMLFTGPMMENIVGQLFGSVENVRTDTVEYSDEGTELDLGFGKQVRQWQEKADMIRLAIRRYLSTKKNVHVVPRVDLMSFKGTVFESLEFINFNRMFNESVIADHFLPDPDNPGKEIKVSELNNVAIRTAIDAHEMGQNRENLGFVQQRQLQLGNMKTGYFEIMEKIVNFGDLFGSRYAFVPENDALELQTIELNKSVKDWERTFDHMYALIERSRPTRATVLNPDSSRTHLFIEFDVKVKNGGDTKLTFVDLAGNEQADENLFDMREEGDGISASLFAIKDVLIEKQSGTPVDSNGSQYQGLYSTTRPEACTRLYCSFADTIRGVLADNHRRPTSVSLYVNLPQYLKRNAEVNNLNRCIAIQDTFGLVNELLENTRIAKYLSFGRRSRRKAGRKTSRKTSRKTTTRKPERKTLTRRVRKRVRFG